MLHTWITERWYALAHNGDKHLGSAACELKPIKHHGGFINYLASYLGKSDQTRPVILPGATWHWMPYDEIEHEGCTYRALPGYDFGVTSTAIVHRFTPPTRYKAKHLVSSSSSVMQRALSKPSNAASSKA